MNDIARMLDKVENKANSFKGLRKGQSLMVALFEVDKRVYDKIFETDADCFYDDGKIDACIKVMRKIVN
jgi:hypothetical protein